MSLSIDQIIVVTFDKLSKVAPDLVMKNGIIVQHIKLTIAIPIKLEAIIQLVTPGLMLLKLSNSPMAQASIRVVKKPKRPIKPKKLNTSPDFFIKYS